MVAVAEANEIGQTGSIRGVSEARERDLESDVASKSAYFHLATANAFRLPRLTRRIQRLGSSNIALFVRIVVAFGHAPSTCGRRVG